MSFKKRQVEEMIQKQINSFFRQEVKDPRLCFVSITRVELNPDFSLAQIYWDSFDNSKRGDISTAIKKVKGRIRKFLAQSLQMRNVPELEIYYDSQFDDQQKIEALLKNEPENL